MPIYPLVGGKSFPGEASEDSADPRHGPLEGLKPWLRVGAPAGRAEAKPAGFLEIARGVGLSSFSTILSWASAGLERLQTAILFAFRTRDTPGSRGPR